MNVKKLAVAVLLLNLILLVVTPLTTIANSNSWWNDDWSFKEEVYIPIDTSTENAKYQPIDTYIEFNQLCWAKNEEEHSVRVIFEHYENFIELESQIYDLNHSDDSHIKACNLVFLIPEEANGNEKYYVYYDDESKSSPDYTDHVEVEEAYYYFAPIPGLPFESYYYKITEDGYIIYGVAMDGEFLEYSTAQQITKFESKTVEVTTPKDGELWASFDYFYNYGPDLLEFSSTIQEMISKEIFVDGNLMVEFGIKSETGRDDFETTATYKYYYCPISNKRIITHVKHEALKATRAFEPESSGNIASLQIGSVRSPSIKELNFGKMFPYMHVYAEDKIIQEYGLDIDPEYTPEGITILNNENDIDLGERAWASFDEGKSGIAHAIILDSNSVIKSGTDEIDGVQIKAWEIAGPGLLGLETDGATYCLTRNSYEKGKKPDLEIPKDFVVEYDAEFFSTYDEGYIGVDEEAKIFQSLAKIRPSRQKEISEIEKETGTCSLTTFVHIAPSIPMGTAISVLTNKKIPYISAELYRDDKFVLTGISERLPINSIPDFKDKKPLEKIKLALGIFDWRNLSFFKKIRFQNLYPGRYTVKIYKENPLLGKERQYIGFKIVDVEDDTKTHIFCKSERSVHISVIDQNDKPVENAEVALFFEDVAISKNLTSSEGQALLKAPLSILNKYNLKIFYNGFIIFEDSIRLKVINKIIPIKKSVEIERYDFTLQVLDTWPLSPVFDVNPVLISKEMDEPVEIFASEKLGDGKYIFKNLLPATYQINVSYKSFSVEETVRIPSEKEKSLIIPAEYDIKIYSFDSRGVLLNDVKISISRDSKKIEGKCHSEGYVKFSIPPGKYNVEVYLKNEIIGKRKINIVGERTFDLVTNNEPIFPTVVTYMALIFVLIGCYFSFRKKDIKSFLKILALSLAIISLISPWWILYGSSTNPTIETSTKMYLFPASLVTTTTTNKVIGGEAAALPDLLSNALTLLSIAIFVGCIFILSNMVFKRFKKNRLSFISLSLGFTALLGSVLVFFIGVSELAKVGVGSFIGNGNLDINIPGEEIYKTLVCNWGPNLGFYLCLLSTIILFSILLFNVKKAFNKKFKSIREFFNTQNIIKFIKKFMPLIGVILLIYLIVDIGTNEIMETFLKLSPLYIIAAALLTIPRALIRNYQWQLILKKQKIFVSYLKSLKIFLIGYFYGAVTPGYMGVLMRVPYLKAETNQPLGKLFVNCFVLSAVNDLVLYFMAIIGAFMIAEHIPEALPLALIALILNVLVYLYFIKKERGEKTFHFFIKFLIPKKAKSYLIRFIDTFYEDFPRIRDFILPALVSIPFWIIMYTQIYILALSLDIEVPYHVFIMFYAIANLIAFIPITTAGLGTREATLIFLFSLYGTAPEKALVISLAGHLITDVLTGVYGFIISVFEARNNKKDLSDLKEIFEENK